MAQKIAFDIQLITYFDDAFMVQDIKVNVELVTQQVQNDAASKI